MVTAVKNNIRPAILAHAAHNGADRADLSWSGHRISSTAFPQSGQWEPAYRLQWANSRIGSHRTILDHAQILHGRPRLPFPMMAAKHNPITRELGGPTWANQRETTKSVQDNIAALKKENPDPPAGDVASRSGHRLRHRVLIQISPLLVRSTRWPASPKNETQSGCGEEAVRDHIQGAPWYLPVSPM